MTKTYHQAEQVTTLKAERCRLESGETFLKLTHAKEPPRQPRKLSGLWLVATGTVRRYHDFW